MYGVVIFESSFGNTRSVADAIGEGLACSVDVKVLEVGAAPHDLSDVDLVVVGGPTHAFGMSKPQTREEAAKKATSPVVSRGEGLREWIGALPAGPDSWVAATFDTRVTKVRRLPGSAAKGAAKALQGHGHRLVARPESFYVEDTQGPLADGELDRAREWGNSLGAAMTATESTPAP